MKNRITLSAAVLILVACTPDPNMQMQTEQSANARAMRAANNPRVTVERIGVFDDNIAYQNRRGVYLIRDSVTGTEWIGVSGVGISEAGSHTTSSGKTTAIRSDER